MNYQMLRYVLGQIFKLEAALMALPLLFGLYYRDAGVMPILEVMLPVGIAGYLLTAVKPKNQTIYAREGFVIVALAWILLSVFGDKIHHDLEWYFHEMTPFAVYRIIILRH